MLRQFLIWVCVTFILVDVQGIIIVSKSKNVIVKDEEKTTLWCATDLPFKSCSWDIPDGNNCKVGPSESKCISDHDIHFNGNSVNCSIKIDRIQENQSGTWACILSDDSATPVREHVEVTVGEQPNVEINAFGTVATVRGVPTTFECTASGGRPAGKFTWRVGDSKDPKGMQVLTSSNMPTIKPDGKGYFKVMEPFNYLPNILHHERKLYCLYSQSDENGKELYITEDHISLTIFYLDEPLEEKREIPETQAGTNLTITLDFGAKPKPEAEDVIWQISSKAGQTEIVTKELEATIVDYYLAKPLELIGENLYRAALVIMSVAESEQKYDHSLKISTRLKKDSQPIHSVTHRFSLSVTPHNGQGGDGLMDTNVDKSSSSSVTTIVVVVLVLVLAIIAAAGTVFYAKKTQRWCFAQPEPKTSVDRTTDPEIQAPLNQEAPNARPIIKHKYSRPE